MQRAQPAADRGRGHRRVARPARLDRRPPRDGLRHEPRAVVVRALVEDARHRGPVADPREPLGLSRQVDLRDARRDPLRVPDRSRGLAAARVEAERQPADGVAPDRGDDVVPASARTTAGTATGPVGISAMVSARLTRRRPAGAARRTRRGAARAALPADGEGALVPHVLGLALGRLDRDRLQPVRRHVVGRRLHVDDADVARELEGVEDDVAGDGRRELERPLVEVHRRVQAPRLLQGGLRLARGPQAVERPGLGVKKRKASKWEHCTGWSSTTRSVPSCPSRRGAGAGGRARPPCRGRPWPTRGARSSRTGPGATRWPRAGRAGTARCRRGRRGTRRRRASGRRACSGTSAIRRGRRTGRAPRRGPAPHRSRRSGEPARRPAPGASAGAGPGAWGSR